MSEPLHLHNNMANMAKHFDIVKTKILKRRLIKLTTLQPKSNVLGNPLAFVSRSSILAILIPHACDREQEGDQAATNKQVANALARAKKLGYSLTIAKPESQDEQKDKAQVASASASASASTLASVAKDKANEKKTKVFQTLFDTEDQLFGFHVYNVTNEDISFAILNDKTGLPLNTIDLLHAGQMCTVDTDLANESKRLILNSIEVPVEDKTTKTKLTVAKDDAQVKDKGKSAKQMFAVRVEIVPTKDGQVRDLIADAEWIPMSNIVLTERLPQPKPQDCMIYEKKPKSYIPEGCIIKKRGKSKPSVKSEAAQVCGGGAKGAAAKGSANQQQHSDAEADEADEDGDVAEDDDRDDDQDERGFENRGFENRGFGASAEPTMLAQKNEFEMEPAEPAHQTVIPDVDCDAPDPSVFQFFGAPASAPVTAAAASLNLHEFVAVPACAAASIAQPPGGAAFGPQNQQDWKAIVNASFAGQLKHGEVKKVHTQTVQVKLDHALTHTNCLIDMSIAPDIVRAWIPIPPVVLVAGAAAAATAAAEAKDTNKTKVVANKEKDVDITDVKSQNNDENDQDNEDLYFPPVHYVDRKTLKAYEKDSCSFCLDDIPRTVKDEKSKTKHVDEAVMMVPCGHANFHMSCVRAWKRLEQQATCPLCRNPIQGMLPAALLSTQS